jgi:hypothetical protein
MRMALPLRKLALTAHITCSVGWLGAVIGFLVLAVAGLVSQEPQTARAVDLTMELIGWLVIVPLCLASLSTGIVQSLGTVWGLFQHYWVLFKLLMNVSATIVLLMYMQTAGHAIEAGSPAPVLHSGATLLLLLAATALSVYKPPGMTPYGVRKRQWARPEVPQRSTP